MTSGQPGGHPERRAPADGLAEPGGDRDTEDVGDRQPDHHRRDGAALAAAREPGSAATSDATPKNAPCGTPHEEARGEEQAVGRRRLPRARWRRRTPSSGRRADPAAGSRAPKNASTGAPTTTPSAYAEIRWPAVGIDTSTPSAICGSRPIAMNSVVPIAKPPMASARTAGPYGAVRTGGGGRGARSSCSPSVKARRPRREFRDGRRQPSDASASLKVVDGRMTAVAWASSGR